MSVLVRCKLVVGLLKWIIHLYDNIDSLCKPFSTKRPVHQGRLFSLLLYVISPELLLQLSGVSRGTDYGRSLSMYVGETEDLWRVGDAITFYETVAGAKTKW